jgi:survival-of-motor-neuron-related-splicing factor 30
MEALAEKLKGLLDKYRLVEQALEADPENAALREAKVQLQEVITLTQDLYDAKQKEAHRWASPSTSASTSAATTPTPTTPKTSPASARHTSLPPAPAAFLTKTKSTVSNGSTSNGLIFEVGSEIEALYHGDNLWYRAVIDSIDESKGVYNVTFMGYGNKQAVKPEEARPPTYDTTVSGVSASASSPPPLPEEYESGPTDASPHPTPGKEGKKKRQKEIPIPKNLKILPTDSEEERARKKRKLKSIKSKNRLMKAEEVRDEKKQSWQKFASKKSRKVGFLTGMRKESIFKSPDSVSGKVGVTGSGAGMTPQPEDLRIKYKKKTVIPTPDAL